MGLGEDTGNVDTTYSRPREPRAATVLIHAHGGSNPGGQADQEGPLATK
jgi:hypothetical protein